MENKMTIMKMRKTLIMDLETTMMILITNLQVVTNKAQIQNNLLPSLSEKLSKCVNLIREMDLLPTTLITTTMMKNLVMHCLKWRDTEKYWTKLKNRIRSLLSKRLK